MITKGFMFLLTVLVAFTLVGCGNGIPQGGNKKVKATVVQIMETKMKDLNMYRVLSDHGIDEVVFAARRHSSSWNELVQVANSKDAQIPGCPKEKLIEALKDLEARIAKMDIHLENIRALPVESNATYSRSAAVLKMNGQASNIEYTAQYNSDGELYVEVFR